MGFVVGFVAEVEAETVAEAEEARVVRIVARADHVDVVALQDIQVFEHVVHGRRVAEPRVAVVAVDAVGLDLFAVDNALNFDATPEGTVQMSVRFSKANRKFAKMSSCKESMFDAAFSKLFEDDEVKMFE